MSLHLICTHPQIALRSCLLPGISFSSCVSFWHLGCRWAGWMAGLHVKTERKFQLKTWYAVVRNKQPQKAAWLYYEKINRCYLSHIFKSKICKHWYKVTNHRQCFCKFQVFLLVSQEQLDKKQQQLTKPGGTIKIEGRFKEMGSCFGKFLRFKGVLALKIKKKKKRRLFTIWTVYPCCILVNFPADTFYQVSNG